MPCRSQWWMCTARPFLAALPLLLICTAAPAQSVPGGPFRAPFQFGNAGGEGHGNGAAEGPWQRRPYPSGNGSDGRQYGSSLSPGPWLGLSLLGHLPGVGGGGSTSPSWPQGFGQPGSGASPPNGGGYGNWPPRQYDPALSATNTGAADPSSYPSWRPPRDATGQPATVTSTTTDGVPPTVRPRHPPPQPHHVQPRPIPRPRAPVPPQQATITLPTAPLQHTAVPDTPATTPPEPPVADTPHTTEPPVSVADAPQAPESPQQVADAPNVPPSQPSGPPNAPPPPPSPRTVTPIGPIVGALAALALLLPTLRLMKAVQRHWRRDRQQRRARVVLIGDAGGTRMMVKDPVSSDPIVELRLLAEPPVTRLRLAAQPVL